MKNWESQLLAGISCLFLLFIVSCQDPIITPPPPTGCAAIQAPELERQYLIQFEEDTSRRTGQDEKNIVQQVINVLQADGDQLVKRCGCSRDIILMEMPDTVDPVERRKTAEDKVEQTSGGSATLFANLQIDLPQGIEPVSFKRGQLRMPPPSKDTAIVAIIDGGIGVDLNGIDQRIWKNPKEVNGIANNDDDANCYKDDFYGYDFTGNEFTSIHPHGTKVASAAVNTYEAYLSATGFDEQEVGLQIMDLKIFDNAGKSTLFDALCASYYAIDEGADVINMSWGYYHQSTTSDTIYSALDTLLTEALKKDVLIVAAAGNDSLNTDTCLFLPAAMAPKYRNIISVAALNIDETKLASFSNFGPGTINLAAPGEGIKVVNQEGVDEMVKGTSFATPFISILAAMSKKRTGEDAATTADRIRLKAVDIGAPLTTKGKLSADNFVELLE